MVEDLSDDFDNSSVFPLEVGGQIVAKCRNLVEVAVDSSADILIWGFSAEGWGAAWAMETGKDMYMTRAAVQKDGSIRYVDSSGDVMIGGVDIIPPTPALPVDGLPLLDGASASNPPLHSRPVRLPRVQRGQRPTRRDGIVRAGQMAGDRMSGTVSVDLVEEVSGIARVDVELRRG